MARFNAGSFSPVFTREFVVYGERRARNCIEFLSSVWIILFDCLLEKEGRKKIGRRSINSSRNTNTNDVATKDFQDALIDNISMDKCSID